MTPLPSSSSTLPPRCDVLVIGAGISGLVAARELRRSRPSWDVRVVDVASYAGGKLRSTELAGLTIDVGAESVIVRRPEGLALVDGLGLSSALRNPGPAGARVLGPHGAAALPPDTLMGVPSNPDSVAESGLLSDEGIRRLRAPREPAPLGDDASVAEVIGSQLGDEVVDRLVEPLLAGVYAGRADRLSLRATVPPLWAALRERPAVLEAVRHVRATSPQQSGPVFATLDGGGIARIPAELIAQDQLSVALGTAARSITRTADEFEVAVGAAPERRAIRARGVVVAVQPQKAAKLLGDVCPAGARELGDVVTSTMAVVALAFRRSDVARVPTSSGLLVPVSSGRAVKAFTFVTTKWPHLSEEYVVVRASIGRVGEDQVLQRDDAELVRLATTDLADLTGVRAVPADAIVQRWAGSLPQYDVGHLARVERIRAAVAAVPGLAVAGATYDGVGIPGCINSAISAAHRIIENNQTMEVSS